MKVAIHIGRMMEVGGAEKAVASLARGLAVRGIEIIFISQFRKDGSACVPIEGVSKIVDIMLRQRSRGLNFIHRIVNFRKIIQQEKPDVIICFMPLAQITAYVSSIFLNIPIVYSERSNGSSHSLVAKLLKRLIFKSQRIRSKIVVQTVGLAEKLKWHFGVEEDVVVISNSILNPKILKQTYEDCTSIVSHGRLVEKKGFDVLIRAFSRLVTEFPTLSLKIAGTGECKNELESLVSSLGLDGKVEFVGHLRNCDEFLASGSIGVYLSRSEGFPNALCEALAVGLPLLASDCDFGPSDLIASGTNGILLPKEIESNLDLIVNEIRILILDAKLRKKLGDNAKNVVGTFSEERNLDIWVDMLQKLVTHKSVR
jgi:GalNAc-alpha-(1->4)-GalNAc-alpha-(1->3)-diNAcBac-PP-undecaprenol alpha-1,4-N-acetyl-D-galactosaminyltransferase